MRGTRWATRATRITHRIIPAHAGNTEGEPYAGEIPEDHPRTCGEHSPLGLPATRCRGSSPHMRGTPPARSRPTRNAGDHPRTCGEHIYLLLLVLILMGSSPHMRGTLPGALERLQSFRIIPAHAGNTRHKLTRTSIFGDHPRTCGEHLARRWALRRLMGSSPHMRGTPPTRLVLPLAVGIIPAHAGNTIRLPPAARRGQDHPRTCGEHYMWSGLITVDQGSSPHMRGTPVSHHPHPREHGIIPAHAGNTIQTRGTRCAPWDHPRTCGEHIRRETYCETLPGSSPHMRGTHES